MKVEPRTVRVEPATLETVDLPLGPGRPTVRLALTHQEGKPLSLAIAVGHGGGNGPDPFRPDRVVVVPGDVLPRFREALDALGGGAAP